MRGNEYFYWNLMQKYRESWVIMRLDLVSLISPLPTYGFWSNLGTYGKLFSRGIQRHRLRKIWTRTRRGRRVLPEINSAVQIKNIGAFLFGNLRSSFSPFDIGSPPSVLIRFQRYWGWFWSRKLGLISGILRGECFILWNWFVKSNIAGQRSRMEPWQWGLRISEVDVWVSL